METIQIVQLDEVDSTNTYAKRHLSELADGTLVVARSQTAGRGRLNRNWVSPYGKNFYGSLVLKNWSDPFRGTMVFSLAALSALSELAPEMGVWLKWPNDLYVGTAKLAGLLAESVPQSVDSECALIVGMGVNLNLSHADLDAIDKPAASFLVSAKKEINVDFFTEKVAEKLKLYYIMGLQCGEALFAAWSGANRLLGRRVVLEAFDRRYVGVAQAIAPDGALVMKLDSGEVKNFYCGDASVDRASLSDLA